MANGNGGNGVELPGPIRWLLVALDEKRLSVVLVVLFLGILTGWVPIRALVCTSPETQQERAERLAVDAKIATTLSSMASSLERIDQRDHLVTCSRITDTAIRSTCLNLIVPSGVKR